MIEAQHWFPEKFSEEIRRNWIRSYLEKEYQFSILWPDDLVVKICFYKGQWQLQKKHDHTVLETIFFNDDGTWEVSNPNQLTSGFIQSRWELNEKTHDWIIARTKNAKVLTEVLAVWGGSFEKIVHIMIVQAGRNGFIGTDGEINCSPE